MRVVHLTNYYTPGLGYQDELLAKYHAQFGHDVHVVTSARAYPRQSNYVTMRDIFPDRVLPDGPTRTEDNFTIHRLPVYLEMNTQTLLRGAPDLIDSLEPDLVIAHGIARLETIRLLYRRGRRPVSYRLVVDDHSLYSGYHRTLYRTAYYAFFRRFLRRRVGLVDRFVPVTAETARFLNERFGVPRESMTVLPIGADTETFRFDPALRSRTRSELGFPDRAFVMIYVGKITLQKGADLVYEASRDILQEQPNSRLLFVGSGAADELAQAILARSVTDGVGNQVLIRPHVPHERLVGFYCCADAAIWPKQETMASLEAASSRCPLVLSDSEVSRERTAGGNGFACATTRELEAALRRLCLDEQLREDMGRAGAAFVRERFSWRAIAERFLNVGLEDSPNGS